MKKGRLQLQQNDLAFEAALARCVGTKGHCPFVAGHGPEHDQLYRKQRSAQPLAEMVATLQQCHAG